MGFTSFYRRFIRGYASIVAPLVKATTLDMFQWSLTTHDAFCQLKAVLMMARVLSLPDFVVPFTVETNASGIGMGAVLSQNGHPSAFFSKSFTPKLLRASTYVQELFAITASQY